MFIRLLAFGALFLGGAELGHFLTFKEGTQVFASFWPPAGLYLAVLAVTGIRRWPLYIAAGMSANLTSNVLLHDMSLPVGLGFALANTVEACLGAWIVQRFSGAGMTLATVRNVAVFVLASAFAACPLGACVGAAVVAVSFDGMEFARAWTNWWLAGVVGVLVVAPVVFAWSNEPRLELRSFPFARIAEIGCLFGGLMWVAHLVFGDVLPRAFAVPILIIPFLLWASLRFGPRTSATLVLALAIIAVAHVSQGRGPYVRDALSLGEQVFRAQGALGITSLSVLFLTALAAERWRSEQAQENLVAQLQSALAEVKTLRGLLPVCAWCNKVRDDTDSWDTAENYLKTRTDVHITHGICPACMDLAIDQASEVGRV